MNVYYERPPEAFVLFFVLGNELYSSSDIYARLNVMEVLLMKFSQQMIQHLSFLKYIATYKRV